MAEVSFKELQALSGIDTTQSVQAQFTTEGTVSGLAANVMIEATGTLSQANLIAMYTTPVEMIAAPASGLAHIIDEIEIFHDYTTAVYTGGGDVSIQYGTSGAAICLADVTLVTGSSDTKRLLKPTIYNLDSTTGTAIGFDISTASATNISVTNATAVFAAGNAANIIKYRIRYHTVTLLT